MKQDFSESKFDDEFEFNPSRHRIKKKNPRVYENIEIKSTIVNDKIPGKDKYKEEIRNKIIELPLNKGVKFELKKGNMTMRQFHQLVSSIAFNYKKKIGEADINFTVRILDEKTVGCWRIK